MFLVVEIYEEGKKQRNEESVLKSLEEDSTDVAQESTDETKRAGS